MSCRQNSIAAKWNIFLSFGLKVPFGFPCLAHVCPSNSFDFVFLKGSHHFGCCAPFWRPCTFACVPVRLYSIGFCRSVAARSLFEVGLACFYKWKTVFLILPPTRDCIFFPGKAHDANSRSAASSLVRMDRP